ncbi:MAG: D-alanyl-D-alanine carboxypeptidase [Defluviitaleaceae bacterium]|nr:D-alanyl-D-alanine carboxypeptidase [Defluviitaleaceae bacterium]
MRSFFVIICTLAILLPTVVWAAEPLNIESPAVILVEQTTGQVLYSRNERERRYPASMSKMLTAMIVLDYLELDEVLVVGPEIRNMPSGYVTNLHAEGESITVEMLLNALLIRSGNETGRVLALNVIRRREGRQNIDYHGQAKHSFSVLMNERARALGASSTHFNNPYGLHSENHFSTAYDMAVITRAFMDNPVLAEIAGIRVLDAWENTNLMLPGGPHGHPYITGAKTGFTTPAGHCLAAAAYNDGLALVTIVMGGNDAMRWQDTRRLMDYGFNNYRFREIARPDEIIETVLVENPRLGDIDYLHVISSQGHTALLRNDEYAAITRIITFDPIMHVLHDDEYQTATLLRAPIEYGAVIGTIAYLSFGEILFEAPVLAGRAVEARSFDSDMDYYLARFFGGMFTRRALPYWFGVFGTAFGIFGIVLALRASRRASRADRWPRHERPRRSRY